MRIHAEERTVIQKILHAYFGDKARIILFGSRTNDQARGGDIDLLVETNQDNDIFTRKLQALSELQITLGDQKIDLLIKTPGMSAPVPCIYSEALATGVEL
jgi:predicted nucleotidyltransferase